VKNTQPRQHNERRASTSLLIYDADCGFCTKSAKWLEGHFRDSQATIAPWQSLELGAFGLTESDVTSAAWWVDADGKNYGAHLSIARAMRACGGALAVAGACLEYPPVSWVAAPVYRWVARHRNQMPGGSDSCST